MNLSKVLLLLLLLGVPATGAETVSAKILKVLPQFLDGEGKTSQAPSLYARDAYQAHLGRQPELRTGMRFAVQWKPQNVKRLMLRVEIRGVNGNKPTACTREAEVTKHGWFSTWSEVRLQGEDYKTLGNMVAWRVTLWDGNLQLAEQKSFLW